MVVGFGDCDIWCIGDLVGVVFEFVWWMFCMLVGMMI